jgi:uncharacterized membrane protein (UPF0136 family)
MFELARLYLFAFGAFTVAGGVIGFVKAKSTASLVAGGFAGALLLLSGYLVGTVGRNGLILGHVVSLALAIRFVSAFRKTRKVMPAGIMAVLAAVGVGLTAAALLHL